jgi:cell fate regulator YaaT (PSP1 superfamily)
MPLVVGVAFKPVTKIYYFDPAGLEDLQPGERVVVETSRGRTLGEVVLPAHEVPVSEISGALKPVVRRAVAWDMVQQDQMAHKEPMVLETCRQRTAALGLDMKIVKVEYSFDGSSLLVYFVSEQRVDFRNLVHDLAQLLQTRVEMRQIGVRDETKFMGGFGKCGRELCCAIWLREFAPVSIKMAKQQDLPLNPPEISGVCGRLLCCLSYEDEFYAETRRHLPRLNSVLMTPQGPGKVKQIHVLRNSVTVQVEGPNDTTALIEVPIVEAGDHEGAPEARCGGCPLGKQSDSLRQAAPRAASEGERTGRAGTEESTDKPMPAAVQAGETTPAPARPARSRRRRRSSQSQKSRVSSVE